MKTLTRTRAIGGSLMVTIPKELVREEQIHEGQLVEIEVKKPKKSFFGIARGVGPFTKEDELKSHD
ncbi:MAG TPA: AbrB/MazE/SpoVT family DNA-binding domain-containing protein [archaeon]|nr:AbrB/MazE/SpoVT family DNA-binding domain-containing protein [archaeon]